jgi:hypothetical protein
VSPTITQGSINIHGNQLGADVLDASGTARVSIKSGINDHMTVHDGAHGATTIAGTVEDGAGGFDDAGEAGAAAVT